MLHAGFMRSGEFSTKSAGDSKVPVCNPVGPQALCLDASSLEGPQVERMNSTSLESIQTERKRTTSCLPEVWVCTLVPTDMEPYWFHRLRRAKVTVAETVPHYGETAAVSLALPFVFL